MKGGTASPDLISLKVMSTVVSALEIGGRRGVLSVLAGVELAARPPYISVSEVFTKNRHLFGFDNPRKALLTCVKEAVDNALDAAEEAGILPDVAVALEVVSGDGAPLPASQATR